MKTHYSPRDLELLSAYLDGQLDRRKKASLEARLKAEPDLRALYQDLERTRTLLRSAPQLKAPRSFKLTPQMVGQVPTRVSPRRIYPVFQLASALATLMLIVVLAGDFLGVTQLDARSGIPAASAPMEQVATVEMEKIVTMEVEEQGSLPAAPAGTSVAGAVEKEALLPTATAAAEIETAPMLQMAEPVTSTDITGSAALSETLTLSAESYLAPDASGAEPQAFPGAEDQADPGILAEEPAPAFVVPWLRILEGGLALLAIVLAAAAISLRRAGR